MEGLDQVYSSLAYDDGRWAALPDARTGDIQAPLALLEALHARWVQLLHLMTEQQFARAFIHPETGNTVSLNAALCYYAWHCKHHTAQIAWVCTQQDARVPRPTDLGSTL